jgi:hypothetical protein
MPAQAILETIILDLLTGPPEKVARIESRYRLVAATAKALATIMYGAPPDSQRPKCFICKTTFDSYSALRNHVVKKHGEEVKVFIKSAIELWEKMKMVRKKADNRWRRMSLRRKKSAITKCIERIPEIILLEPEHAEKILKRMIKQNMC